MANHPIRLFPLPPVERSPLSPEMERHFDYANRSSAAITEVHNALHRSHTGEKIHVLTDSELQKMLEDAKNPPFITEGI